MSEADSIEALTKAIARYNDAWNAQDLDEAPPTGRQIRWDGIDSIPFEDRLIKRKDVYSDSVSILRQVGLLD